MKKMKRNIWRWNKPSLFLQRVVIHKQMFHEQRWNQPSESFISVTEYPSNSISRQRPRRRRRFRWASMTIDAEVNESEDEAVAEWAADGWRAAADRARRGGGVLDAGPPVARTIRQDSRRCPVLGGSRTEAQRDVASTPNSYRPRLTAPDQRPSDASISSYNDREKENTC